MATMQHARRPMTVRLVLVTVVAVVLGLTLAWAVTPAEVHAADAPATPGNEMLDAHAWGESGCTLPGAAIDSVSGLFDFRHACIHHDGCYQGFDRMGDAAVIDRVRCDELFRTDLTASCEYLHGTIAELAGPRVREHGQRLLRGGAVVRPDVLHGHRRPLLTADRATVLPWQHPGTRPAPVSCRQPPGDPCRLRAVLPADRILTDTDVLTSYLHDEAEWAEYGRALAVVRPLETAEVAATVAVCARHRVPVVPRGAGTGLSGGANAVEGGIVLSTERMRRIVEIDPAERLAVVQPGVVNDVLRAAAAERGLWYPPDPASAPWSTIGGNVATNAGGLCCVKYGVTRDYVLALEVVTASGEVVRLGRRTAKGVTGYDLVGLMVGSEGTLGVITEVTVRLRPARPASSRTVVGFFDTLAACGAAVAGVTARGLQPAEFELIDRHCLQAVNEWKRAGFPDDAAALLLARTDLPEPAGGAEAEAILDEFEAAGARDAVMSTDPVEAEALFDARRLAYPALEQRGDAMLTEDVCLPRGRLAEMLARVEEIGVRHDVLIANIAHAGDGNLHPLLITKQGDDAARARAQAAFDDIVNVAIDLGGTVTGEHGVGLLKRAGMHRELGPGVLAMQRAVKAALDPHDILNPGKAVG